MPLAMVPSIRPDADIDELRSFAVKLNSLLDEWLLHGLDDKNIKRGGISLGSGSPGVAGNVDGRYITLITHETPNTETEHEHGLGRAPCGYIVVRNTNGGIVYDGTSIWTGSKIYIRCTTGSNVVKLLVF
jgi:hypothetical protein